MSNKHIKIVDRIDLVHRAVNVLLFMFLNVGYERTTNNVDIIFTVTFLTYSTVGNVQDKLRRNKTKIQW